MDTPATEAPYRLVDRHAVGWITQGNGLYASDHTNLALFTLDQLEADRGPVRPVIPMPEDDTAALVEALTKAGRKALITVAVALHDIAVADMNAHRGEHGRGSIITAGRPGSWESHTMRVFVWQLGGGVPASRIDAAALEVCREIFTRWTTGPAGYVEVAENLAVVLGQVADTTTTGMAGITDQWLMRHEGFETFRNWALSLSSKHGPDTWY